jgi:hypothetical protein
VPEQFWLDKYWGSGLLYNSCPIAGSPKGIKRKPRSEESKEKSRKSALKRLPVTEEHKKHISESLIGSKLSEETKKKIADKLSFTWQITYPNGEIKIIKNLNQFCKDNNLNQGNMCLVSQGKKKHHKGFFIKISDN